MAFDVYQLIRSKEMREFLRNNRKFELKEQEIIIRNSYYPIEQKLQFLKQLLEENLKDGKSEEEKFLEERVRLYEYIVNFIQHPEEEVIYAAKAYKGFYFRKFEDLFRFYKEYRAFHAIVTINVDMVLLSAKGESKEVESLVKPVSFQLVINLEQELSIRSFTIDSEWFERKGFSDTYFWNRISLVPFPFENGSRLCLKTPKMKEPLYGIFYTRVTESGDRFERLYIEDENYDYITIKRILEQRIQTWWEYEMPCTIQCIHLNRTLLEDGFLVYDWITSRY